MSAQRDVPSAMRVILVCAGSAVRGTTTKQTQGSAKPAQKDAKHAHQPLYVLPARVGIGRWVTTVCRLVNSLVLHVRIQTQVHVQTAMEVMF